MPPKVRATRLSWETAVRSYVDHSLLILFPFDFEHVRYV